MKIQRHIPNCCRDGCDPLPEPVEFNDLQELMDIDFVKQWSENPTFFRYSISVEKVLYHDTLLMAEMEEGKSWWVIGYLSGENIEDMQFPHWHAPASLGGE